MIKRYYWILINYKLWKFVWTVKSKKCLHSILFCSWSSSDLSVFVRSNMDQRGVLCGEHQSIWNLLKAATVLELVELAPIFSLSLRDSSVFVDLSCVSFLYSHRTDSKRISTMDFSQLLPCTFLLFCLLSFLSYCCLWYLSLSFYRIYMYILYEYIT